MSLYSFAQSIFFTKLLYAYFAQRKIKSFRILCIFLVNGLIIIRLYYHRSILFHTENEDKNGMFKRIIRK